MSLNDKPILRACKDEYGPTPQKATKIERHSLYLRDMNVLV